VGIRKKSQNGIKKGQNGCCLVAFFLLNHQAKENCSIFLFAYWYFFFFKEVVSKKNCGFTICKFVCFLSYKL